MVVPTKTIKNRLIPTLRGVVKGIFSQTIKYETLNPSGDWTKYYGKWENQKRNWTDLNVCWSYAGTEVMETQLQAHMMEGRMSQELIAWFKEKGYIDEDGDFYLARRFIPVLSGRRYNGNDEAEHWRLAEKYGMIPNWMYPFVEGEDYFDTTKITQAMYDMGKEFKKRVKIESEELGDRFTRRDKQQIQTALYQAPLQIGIPIPKITDLWNEPFVQWDGSMIAAHSVEVRGIDNKGNYLIFDSYNLNLKTLSADYYIPIITRGILTPINPIVIPTVPKKFTIAELIAHALAVFWKWNAKDPQIPS